MSAPPPTPEQMAAAAAAARQFNIEAFTLLGVGLLVTVLRTYVRVASVGWKRLAVDDYLVWFAAICYSVETALAYNVGYAAHGLANNGMTPEQRASLSPDSPEWALRILGSKIQIAGWTTYGTLLWALKGSLLVFYTRLTAGLGRHYEIRIYIGYALVIVSYLVVIINLYGGCRPFNRNWQINPDPGDVCQPAVSAQVVWVYLAFNVITDLYLLSIPLPMLWAAALKPLKKAGLMVLFGGGILVIACATLRCVLIITDPVNGAQLAGSWAVRETFIAVVTTNLPMVYPLFYVLLGRHVAAWVSTMRSTHKTNENTDDLVTIGGGNLDSGIQRKRAPRSNPMTNVTFSESEERMMGVMELNDIKAWSENGSGKDGAHGHIIQKDVEVAVVTEVRDSDVEDSHQRQRQQVAASIDESTTRRQGHFAFAKGPFKSKRGGEV